MLFYRELVEANVGIQQDTLLPNQKFFQRCVFAVNVG